MSKYEIISIVCSSVALAISIFIPIIKFLVSLRLSRKTRENDMQTFYFCKIFDEYLIEKIPATRSRLSFHDGKLERSYQDLVDVICKLKHKVYFYSFQNNNFYITFTEKLNDLEDYIIKLADKSNVSEQSFHFNQIDQKIANLYNYIFEFQAKLKK